MTMPSLPAQASPRALAALQARRGARRTMQGVYSPANYVLPSNSLPTVANLLKAVIHANGNGGYNGGMAGAYGPPAARWPGAYSRRSMPTLSGAGAGMGLEMADVTTWVSNNAMLVGLSLGGILLLGMIGRRR